ncbi:Ferredoxin [Nocardia otitidiscaviarum]|uniref:Ferredoxin n=1 Tax=Nocardia otitidiscaviarum TaxID=1823 RepID=A0A379JLF7_9NOCA|nr:ferredoxin [Nocardia otitidiscaviarum]MBF6180169.1 ferredoxin [Nocardia otitidiscaviarum]MBF6239286.1 ferredoxin [Nocardia otitidiscaviarum]SUD49041.1 Ferredoxin [Nocardia otitidiscaviarum]
MRIEADLTRCAGHGMCEAVAPELFRVGDDERVAVRCAEVPESEREVALLAVDSCPTQALRSA